MMKNRNIQLDVIRCVALFLIILCHTNIGLEDAVPFIDKLKWFVGKCGVPLFLIISGYLNLPMKYEDKEFISKRFKRVFLPFLFWSVVYFILDATTRDGIVLKNIFSEDCFLIASSSHLWYIYAILALYLITPIISEYFQKCSKIMFRFYLIIWLISALFTYYYHWTGHTFFDHNFTYITYYLSGYLGYYILGYYIKRFSPELIFNQLNIRNSFVLGSIFFLAIFFIYIGYFILNMTTVEISKYTTIVPILFSIIAFSILWKIKVKNVRTINVIDSLSKCSFGIYLIHEIVIIYVFPLLIGKCNWNEFNDATLLLINILLVFMNVMISYFVIRLLSFFPKSKYIIG